ncbi:hypothetical protein AVEN_49098-1, partial [Araneus ventricosus]
MRNWLQIYFLVKHTPNLHLATSRLLPQKCFHQIVSSKSHYHHKTSIQNIRTFHTSNIYWKARKTREEKKHKNIIQFKPKSKLPTIQLWRGCNALEIADITKRDLDDVFEAISYLENSQYYDDPELEESIDCLFTSTLSKIIYSTTTQK